MTTTWLNRVAQSLPCLGFAWVLAAAPGNASAASAELQALVGAPYAESVVAASRAERFAWVLTVNGIQNIWTAAAPDFKPVALTHFSADDGQPILRIALSPDGTTLAFVKGFGGSENPASLVAADTNSLWILRIADGNTRSLGSGTSPEFSPAGDRLLFRRENQLLSLTLGSAAEAPSALPAGIGSYRWSPSGDALAFVSERGTHSFIGVYRPKETQITWMEPGADFDSNPAWSPDGSQLAFIRSPAQDRSITRSAVDPRPMSIWIADARSGTGGEIWRSGSDGNALGRGQDANALRWSPTGDLVFYSEHEGWLRLYRLRPDGSRLTALTPDGCEVDDSRIDAAGGLLFSANCGDLDRRHLWTVGADGRNLRQLTNGPYLDTAPQWLAGGRYVVFRRGEGRRPQGIALRDARNGEIRRIDPVPLPKIFHSGRLSEPLAVSFPATDGKTVHGQLLLPQSSRPARHPAVVFVHGGPFFQTLLGWHDIGVFAVSYAFNQYLVQQGYVVLSVNYRLSSGYGRDFRHAPDSGPRGAAEYRDVLGAARYLQSRPDVDPQRIGIWGGSYGGYLTALALAKDSAVFKAGVDLCGFHDWTYFWPSRPSPASAFGVTPAQLSIASDSSPLGHLDAWKSAVLVSAGDHDEVVPIEESIDLVQRLRQRGVPVETLIMPDEQHIFSTFSKLMTQFERMNDFFERRLAGSRSR